MNEEALEKLRKFDWREISANLFVAAIGLAVRYGWGVNSSLPNGQSIAGLVNQAIVEIWQSPDRLDPNLPIHVQLAGIVKSKLYNLSKCCDGDVVRTEDLATIPVDTTQPSSEEKTRLFKRVIELLSTSPRIKGHEDRELVVMAMSEGILTVKDLAAATGLSDTRIYQVNREIREIYPTIREQISREEC